jgi:hypothetical protein
MVFRRRQKQGLRIAFGLVFVMSIVVQAQDQRRFPRLRSDSLTQHDREELAQRIRRPLIHRRARVSIRRGLDWLAKKQQRRGLWLGKKPAYRVGFSALSGLAFLSAGSVGRRGKYSEVVERVSRYLAENQRYEPDFVRGLYFDKQAELGNTRPLHGHGLALLYLSQCYGELQNPALREKVRRSILKGLALTQSCQSKRGGWNYMPGDEKDEGSVTVTQIQGLRAARNVGFVVDKAVIDNAIQYIVKSQDYFGGIRYRMNSGKTTPALTAAGLSVLHGAGVYSGETVGKSLHYLNSYLVIKHKSTDHFFFYGHFYAGQAYFQQGRESYRSYYKGIREELLRLQRGDGSWENKVFGNEYATAMALLILQMPDSHLPIYQR